MQQALRKHETTSLQKPSETHRKPTKTSNRLLQDLGLKFNSVPAQHMSGEFYWQKQTFEFRQETSDSESQRNTNDDFPERLKDPQFGMRTQVQVKQLFHRKNRIEGKAKALS